MKIKGRGCLRYSVRAVIAATALVAVLSAVVSSRYRRLCAFEDAVRQLGGSITYYGSFGRRPVIRTLLYGIDDINLSFTDVTSEEIRQLVNGNTGVYEIPFRSIGLECTRIDDDGLLHLVPLRHLKEVYLDDAVVTTEGVNRFRKQRPDVVVHFNRGSPKIGGVISPRRKNPGIEERRGSAEGDGSEG